MLYTNLIVLISYPAFVFKIYYDFGLFGTFEKGVLWTYVLKNLYKGTLLQKICSLSLIILSQCSVKIFAHNSISAYKFCKNMQKFACSGFLEVNTGLPDYENLENKKFDTYWLTLLYNVHVHKLLIKYSRVTRMLWSVDAFARRMNSSPGWAHQVDSIAAGC